MPYIQILCNFVHAHTGYYGIEDVLYHICFFRYNNHIPIFILRVAIGNTAYFVTAILHTLLCRPLHIFRDGLRFILCQTADDGQNQLAFHTSGIEILFLKIYRNAIGKQFSYNGQAVNRISGKSAHRFGQHIINASDTALIQKCLQTVTDFCLSSGDAEIAEHARILPIGMQSDPRFKMLFLRFKTASLVITVC